MLASVGCDDDRRAAASNHVVGLSSIERRLLAVTRAAGHGILVVGEMSRQITALKRKPRSRHRVLVVLDDGSALDVAEATAQELRVGLELSEEGERELRVRDLEERALQKAAHLLQRRPRSERELRSAWSRARIPEAAQLQALERLKASGLVNDQEFARAWAENRRVFRPRSGRMLRSELRRRGVPDDAIEFAVGGLDEDQSAHDAALKVARRLAGQPWEAFRRRLYSYLARRGFDHETVIRTVTHVWDEITGTHSGQESEDSR